MKQRFRGLLAGVMLLAITSVTTIGCPASPNPSNPTDVRLITGKVIVPKIISNGTAKIISNGGAKIISNGGAKYRIAATESDMEASPAKHYAVILQDARGNFLGDGIETADDGSYTLSVRLGVVIPAGKNKAVAQVVAYNDAKAVVSAQVILDRNSASGKPISVNLDKVSTLMAMTGKAAIAAGKDPESAVQNFEAQTAANLLEKAGEALMSVAVADLSKIDELVNLNPDTIVGENKDEAMMDEIQNALEESNITPPPELAQVIEKAKDLIETAPPPTVATPAPPTPAPNTTPTPAPTPRVTLEVSAVAIATPATDSINALDASGSLDPLYGFSQVALSASVTSNLANGGVNWTITNAGGSNLAELVSPTSSSCILRAKQQTAAGDVRVRATSKNDSTKFDEITIHVTIRGGLEVGVK